VIRRDRKTVLVTDAGRGSGLAIVRSLGRAGYRIVAADADARSLAFRSRFAHERLVVPDPTRSPAAFAEAVTTAVETFGVDLIVPVTDEAIHPLAHRRDALEAICRLAIGPSEGLALTTDKSLTLELAQRLAIEAPATRVVRAGDTDDALRAADELSRPIVVKPAVSRRFIPERDAVLSQSVTYARDAGELVDALARLDPSSSVLLQEYVAGEGHGVGILAHDGKTLAAFQHRRLAEIPVTGGASAWRESVALDARLYDASARLVEALRWTGLIMIEFKLGARPLLMEINGRAWGSLPLAVRCGVDLPRMLAELYLHGPEHAASPADDTAPGSYRVGIRSFNLELIWPWILQVLRGRHRLSYLPAPRRRDVLPVLLGLVDVRQGSDIVALEDPLPGLAQMPRIVNKLLRKVRASRRVGAEE